MRQRVVAALDGTGAVLEALDCASYPCIAQVRMNSVDNAVSLDVRSRLLAQGAGEPVVGLGAVAAMLRDDYILFQPFAAPEHPIDRDTRERLDRMRDAVIPASR